MAEAAAGRLDTVFGREKADGVAEVAVTGKINEHHLQGVAA